MTVAVGCRHRPGYLRT